MFPDGFSRADRMGPGTYVKLPGALWLGSDARGLRGIVQRGDAAAQAPAC